jgi:hypothetical protein
MTGFKKVILKIDCGGHVSERTFLDYLNQIDSMAYKVFEGKASIVSAWEQGQDNDEITRICDEHYYLKQTLIALDNHTREHGMISRLLFTEILNVGLFHSGISLEGIND